MNEVRQPFFKNLDYYTVALYFILVGLGWLTIYAASYDIQSTALFDIKGRTGSQIMWMGVSVAAIILILVMDHIFIKGVTPWFYILMMILLAATIFLAPDIKGSHSWLVITPSIRLQPAEFAKLATALMLARWCSRYEFDIHNRNDLATALAIFLLPMAIIVLQNETGSAVVFATFFLVLFREGLTGSILLLGFFMVALFISALKFAGVQWGDTNADVLVVFLLIYLASYIAVEVFGEAPLLRWISAMLLLGSFAIAGIVSLFTQVNFAIPAVVSTILFILYLGGTLLMQRGKRIGWVITFSLLSIATWSSIEYFFNNVLREHQQKRILVSLGLKDDPSGAGYNVNQSMIAIGSGGLLGKGFLNGTQTKLKYVPEQDTDFIFCTIGEEWGFVGSSLVLLLYLVFLLRLVYLAERQSEIFARIYGYSVCCILFFHLTVNIGMVIGLVPVIGIPLPYFSYGGSSLLSFTMLLFIFLRLDASRKER